MLRAGPLLRIYIRKKTPDKFRAMRAATDISVASRAGRRLNAKDSLMVHWDRPAMSATSRHHKLQLPLLLEMVQNQPQNKLFR